MKTASKVTLIISIILSVFIMALVSVITFVFLDLLLEEIKTSGDPDANMVITMISALAIPGFVIAILACVISIVIASITLYKVCKNTSKDKLMVWGILSAIFCDILPGILVLCIKDENIVKANDVVIPEVIKK